MTSHEMMKAKSLGYPFLMLIFLGKNFLKCVVITVALICSAGLLTSCGASKEEKALEANCERIFSNLKAIKDTPENIKNSSVADSDSVPLLSGEESRNRAESQILSEFPFLDQIVVGRPRDEQRSDTSPYPGLIYVIEKALNGTDLDFPYSQEEMLVIATTEDSWEDLVLPLAHKIFGDYFELKNHQGCAVVDARKKIQIQITTPVLHSSAPRLSIPVLHHLFRRFEIAKSLAGIREISVQRMTM